MTDNQSKARSVEEWHEENEAKRHQSVLPREGRAAKQYRLGHSLGEHGGMYCQLERLYVLSDQCMKHRNMFVLPAGSTMSGLAVAERRNMLMMSVKILLNMFLVGRLPTRTPITRPFYTAF